MSEDVDGGVSIWEALTELGVLGARGEKGCCTLVELGVEECGVGSLGKAGSTGGSTMGVEDCCPFVGVCG